MNKLTLLAALCSGALLQACGGSSDPEAPEVVTPTTDFAISVDAPPSLVTAQISGLNLFPRAYADSVNDLEKENFSVAIIDADGNVIEIVELEDDQWSREEDGSYVITLPGGERLDCVILVDLDGQPSLVLNEPLPSDNLFAPTTSDDFQVDLSSTAAYRAVVEQIAAASTSADDWGDFAASVGGEATQVDLAQALVSEVIEQVREEVEQAIIDAGADFTLEDILENEDLQELAENVVERVETETGAEAIDMATLLEGGFWWVDAEKSWDGDAIEFETGKVTFDGTTTTESIFEWESDSGEAPSLSMPDEEYAQSIGNTDPNEYDVERWVLGSSSETLWLEDYDMLLFRSASADGALLSTLGLEEDTALDRVISVQELDIGGSSIRAFAATPDSVDLVPLIPATATFSPEARAYLGSETPSQDHYRIEMWDDCDLPEGEFCNRVYLNLGGEGDNSAPTSLNALVSAMPAEDNNYAMQGVWLTSTQEGNVSTLGEFVDDEAKTANFYKVFHNEQRVEKLAFTSTWAMETVNGQEMLTVMLPEELLIYGAYDDELDAFFAVVDDIVRRGKVFRADEGDNFYLFNQAAIEDLIAVIYREACDLESLEADFTEQEYKDFFSACQFLAAGLVFPNLYDERVLRINAASELRSYEFNAEGMLDFYKNTEFTSELNYSITDEGFIRIDYGEGDYDLLTITGYNDELEELKVAAFSMMEEGSTEAWSFMAKSLDREEDIDECYQGDSDWDDENSVPVEGTEKVFSDFSPAIEACQQTIGGRSLAFNANMLMDKALMASDDDDGDEYYLFTGTMSGNEGWYSGELRLIDEALAVPFEWQVSEAGKLMINATFNEEGQAIELEETIAIFGSDGIYLGLKIFAQQSNWPSDFDYMSEDEGEVWTDYRMLVDDSMVPALP